MVFKHCALCIKSATWKCICWQIGNVVIISQINSFHPWITLQFRLKSIWFAILFLSMQGFFDGIKLYHYGAKCKFRERPLFCLIRSSSMIFHYHVNIVPEGFCFVHLRFCWQCDHWRFLPLKSTFSQCLNFQQKVSLLETFLLNFWPIS